MDDCFSDCSAGSSAWIFLLTPAPIKKDLLSLLLPALFEFKDILLPLGLLSKFFLDKHWPTLLVSVISLINLERSSPNNSLECSPCGKDKCLYAIFSSAVILSLRNVSKSWLSFPNVMAKSVHFFNEAFSNSKSSCVSVKYVPLYKESNKKQIMLWFLRIRFCKFWNQMSLCFVPWEIFIQTSMFTLFTSRPSMFSGGKISYITFSRFSVLWIPKLGLELPSVIFHWKWGVPFSQFFHILVSGSPDTQFLQMSHLLVKLPNHFDLDLVDFHPEVKLPLEM